MINKLACIICLVFAQACAQDKVEPNKPKILTENVILVVIDGPRYSETFGDASFSNVPKQYELLSECTFFENFSNSGNTFTVPGHSALITGFYENISNNGTQYPSNQNVINYWLSQTNFNSNDACIIASKDKLQILAGNESGSKKPYLDCGISGLGSGYREDSTTQKHLIQRLTQSQQRFVLVNFLGPDSKGHENNWLGYLNAIKETDQYIYDIWNFLETNPMYKNKTTFIVTNDHGRHNNGIADGFVSHGDGCAGCRKIQCQIFSPDTEKGIVIKQEYNQTNIAATIAYLLKVPGFYEGKGISPMWEVFKK